MVFLRCLLKSFVWKPASWMWDGCGLLWLWPLHSRAEWMLGPLSLWLVAKFLLWSPNQCSSGTKPQYNVRYTGIFSRKVSAFCEKTFFQNSVISVWVELIGLNILLYLFQEPLERDQSWPFICYNLNCFNMVVWKLQDMKQITTCGREFSVILFSSYWWS